MIISFNHISGFFFFCLLWKEFYSVKYSPFSKPRCTWKQNSINSLTFNKNLINSTYHQQTQWLAVEQVCHTGHLAPWQPVPESLMSKMLVLDSTMLLNESSIRQWEAISDYLLRVILLVLSEKFKNSSCLFSIQFTVMKPSTFSI